MSKNIHWHKSSVSRQERNKLLGFQNKVVWFTGLSGSGKSTIAHVLERKLHEKGVLAYVLDGDNVRHGLNQDLGFSKGDREENIRRVSEIARLFYDAGLMTIVAFISPYKKGRDTARKHIGKNFIEVFVKCPVEICEERDPKGLYKKALKNEINRFTGVSAPYEEPENPEIVLETDKINADECVKKIMQFLKII